MLSFLSHSFHLVDNRDSKAMFVVFALFFGYHPED
jgi:hypothetical protein